MTTEAISDMARCYPLFLGPLPRLERLDCLLVDLVDRRLHNEKGQNECKAYKHLVGWCCLGIKRRSGEMKYNDDPGKGRHHDNDGRCKGTDGGL